MLEFLQKNISLLGILIGLGIYYAIKWRTGISWYCNIFPCETMQSLTTGNVKTYRLGFLSVIGICLLPIVSVLLVGLVANSLGCRVDEGSVHPCIFCGIDIGPVLYVMGVSGWFMLVSLPVAAITSILWVVYEIARLVIRHVS